MTNKEFFKAIIDGNTITDEMKEHAQRAIEKLEKATNDRKNKPSKKSLENEVLKEKILDFIAAQEAPCVASEIAEGLDISTSKASALCCQLVKDEKLETEKVKSNNGKVKGYHFPTIPSEITETTEES